MRTVGRAAVIVAAAMLGVPAIAQQVSFGASHDATQPVEITSDRLDLDQAGGSAVFTGGVRVGQGALRLAADRVEVYYDESGGSSGTVRRMVAAGNVTLSNGTEAAESQRATYEVAAGRVEMEGDVLLTQGRNAVSSQRLTLDLNAGTGQLEGRVQTIFVPGTRP